MTEGKQEKATYQCEILTQMLDSTQSEFIISREQFLSNLLSIFSDFGLPHKELVIKQNSGKPNAYEQVTVVCDIIINVFKKVMVLVL